MDIQITDTELIREVANDMCHNYYYLVHGRIYGGNSDQFKGSEFVVSFDAFEVQEFTESEEITETDRTELLDTLIWAETEEIKTFNDCGAFLRQCEKSIENYNNIRL